MAGLVSSTSEAMRSIAGGGVKLDGEKVSNKGLVLKRGSNVVVQVGKRRFARISVK
jgi:tyrosyl-tRNA synthetase